MKQNLVLLIRRCSVLIALLIACSLPLSSHIVLASEPGVEPGTVITLNNWQKYTAYMPEGLQLLLAGKEYWKFPPDFRMVIGPTHHLTIPKPYVAATEKYGRSVRIVDLPNGEHSIAGYVAGLPFPNPQPPHQGYKILVDDWFKYVPYLACGYVSLALEDRYGNFSPETDLIVYRRLDHTADDAQPVQDPDIRGVDYAEYIMVVAPEQAKYTAQLTLYYSNLTKPEDLFLFIPALRRTLRLSSAARCSPLVGLDLTQDDARDQYNGGIARFDAHLITEKPILDMLVVRSNQLLDNLTGSFYMPIFFPKPALGDWELRNAYVIDVRRIPSQRNGYCYGKRIMYVDKEGFMNIWVDLYDANMRYWKLGFLGPSAGSVPDEGMVPWTVNWAGGFYDFQNSHLTVNRTTDLHGHRVEANEECRNYDGHNFTDKQKYATLSGLNEIMR